jgi:hypothetical protein
MDREAITPAEVAPRRRSEPLYADRVALDTTREPPSPAVLQELLDESLALLEAAVTGYHERGEVVLIAPAATTIRKLCHATRWQTPLLAQVEAHGAVVPEFPDASPGTAMGFGVTFHFRWPQIVNAKVTSPIEHEKVGLSPWREWWKSNALCLPADSSTGWQAGRLSISRERLVTEWANRYGGAHVDTKGAERWLTDLVNMELLGYWSDTINDGGRREAALVWFDQPHSSDVSWHQLTVPSRALAHLVLVRLAAEVTTAYGRPVPDTVATMFGIPTPPF